MAKYRAYEQVLFQDMPRVVLEGENAQAAIVPMRGFNWYSFIVDGREVMTPVGDLGRGGYGAPVMFPTPNRVRDCHYTFRGKTYHQTKAGKEVYLHGLVGSEPFSYEYGSDDTGAWVTGSISIKEGDHMIEGYPFPCTLTMTYKLSGKAVTLSYSVENQGSEDMPFGFGVHTYFTKMGDPSRVEIMVPADGRYEAIELLPTGNLLPNEGPEYGIASFRKLSELDLDDVYYGLGGANKDAKIRYLDWGKEVTLSCSEEFKHMVVFCPHRLVGFCMENQTNMTDFINMNEKGQPNTGILVAKAGEKMGGFIKVEVDNI